MALKRRKKKDLFDLGWDKIIGEYTAIPMKIEGLERFEVRWPDAFHYRASSSRDEIGLSDAAPSGRCNTGGQRLGRAESENF